MSPVVVRCPECLSAARVESDAVGQMVACPGCQAPFIAAEEVVPTVQPKPGTNTNRPASPKPPRRRPRPVRREEPPPETHTDKPHAPDPVHDPHHPHIAGLPLSVLIGLALLPFGIPLLWWAAPTITGKAAMLSIAVPLSLAVAASTLCLGVVYTIDWTGTTRVKGVLMLVGLAYLSAAGLYFLKEDMVNRFRGFIEVETMWEVVDSPEGRFSTRMPNNVEDAKSQPIPKVTMEFGKKATYQTVGFQQRQCLVLSGTPEKPPAEPPNEEWYAEIGAHLAKSGTITSHSDIKNPQKQQPGHEWVLTKTDGSTRIVRVFVQGGRVYYLSVEGRGLLPNEKEVEYFFQSFEILPAKR